MAGAVNIRFGLIPTDYVSGIKTVQAATSQFVSTARTQFESLKGSADAPAGAFSSLTRQLNVVKREIGDVLASGGTVSAELATKYSVLQNALDAVRGSFGKPLPVSAFADLNQKLSETKSRIQDILASGGSVPDELRAEFKQLESQVSRVNQEFARPVPVSAFAGLNQRLAETKAKMQDILATGKRVPPELAAQYARLNQRVKQLNDSFKETPSLLQQVGSYTGLSGLAGSFLSLTAILAGLRQALGIVSDFTRIDEALKAVSTSSADYARTQSLLLATSDQLGISYEALATSYKGIKAASNGTALEGQATEKIFLSIVHAGAALKLSNDEVKGSLLAVQQMMSKGTIQAEELRGQLSERLPGAFGLLAKALKVTEPELGKLLENGQVLAADALPLLANELERTFGAKAQANINTMAGGFTRLLDQSKLFIAEFSKTAGIDSFFAKLGNGIANYLLGLREAQKRGEGLFLLSGDRRRELTNQARQRDEFTQATPDRRKEILADLNRQRETARQRSQDPNLNAAIRNANAREEELLQERILNLKKAGLKIYVQERREAEKAEQAKIKSAQPKAFNIDQARKQQGILEKQIQNLVGGGKAVPAELRRQYDTLTAQIDRAANATKKQREETQKTYTVLDVLQRAQKAINDEIQTKRSLGIDVPTSLYFRLDQVTAQIRRVKGEAEEIKFKPIELDPKDRLERTRRVLSDFYEPFAKLPALAARFNEVLSYGSLDYFQDQITKIKAQIEKFSLKNLAVPDSTMDSLAKYILEVNRINKRTSDTEGLAAIRADNLAGGTLPNVVDVQRVIDQIRAGKDAINLSVQEVAQSMQSGRAQLAQAGADLLGGLGESIGKGENPLKSALQSVLSLLSTYIIQLGTALLLSSAALLAAAPLTFGITLAPGISQKLAGAGLIVAGGLIKGLAATALESGGLATGATYALIGESAKARAGGGEFVASVDMGAALIGDKITKNLLKTNTQRADASRSTPAAEAQQIDFRLRKGDLAASIQDHTRANRFLS